MKTTISIFAAFAAAAVIAAPVKVSSFGFDKNNATKCVQAALDSEHRDLIIDNTGSDWIVDPLILRSNKNIVLDEKTKANMGLLYLDDHTFPRKCNSLLGQIRVL